MLLTWIYIINRKYSKYKYDLKIVLALEYWFYCSGTSSAVCEAAAKTKITGAKTSSHLAENIDEVFLFFILIFVQV